jgi:hypothetical protein
MRKQRLTETSRNPQQENDQRTETNKKHQGQLDETGETIRGVIKEFRKMEQTTENWESWQQEIDNKVECLEEGTRKSNIVIFGIAESGNWGNYCIKWFRVLRRFFARLTITAGHSHFHLLSCLLSQEGRVPAPKCWYEHLALHFVMLAGPMGNESPDKGHDIVDVTSKIS